MERKSATALGLLLVTAVVVAYVPALRAGFVWNDTTYVTENPTLDGLAGLSAIWTDPHANEQYYPLVFTTFWVEKLLWGLHPLGYHLVNVLLHACGALLLWRLLRRLALPGAWLAAAAFALHPVCVESVAWVTERKNTLSLVLTLLSAHAFLSWRAAREEAGEKPRDAAVEGRTGSERKEARKEARREARREAQKLRRAAAEVPLRQRPRALYAAALAAFTLALLAKTTASVLPAVLLVLLWWKAGRLRWSDVRPVVPFFAVGVALAAHTAWLERTMVQAKGEEWALGLAGRLVLAGRVTTFYAAKLLWPAGLSFVYPRWRIDPSSLVEWLPALGWAAALAGGALLAHRGFRGPLAALLLFGGVLFPAMGFFNVYAMRYSYVADHFAYQAVAVGASALVCGLASLLASRGTSVRRAAAALGVALLALLGAASSVQARGYRDAETLWTETLARNPECFLCLTNYGNLLLSEGRIDEAVKKLEASLAIKPDAIPTLLNLAQVAEEKGDLATAADRVKAALKVDPTDGEMHVHLATLYTKAGRLPEAFAEYQEALRHPGPGDYLAHNGLGAVLMQLGRPAEAIEHFRACVALRPDYQHGRENLERALAMTGGR